MNIARQFGAEFIKADLTIDRDIDALFDQALQKFDKLHITVNNAGRADLGGLIAEQNITDFDEMYNLNVRAAYQILQLAARHVSSGGSIINTASIAAMSGGAGGSAYYASKATLVSLTQSLVLELAHKNIRVNAVSPGLIESEIWNEDIPHAMAKELVPIRRVGGSDEAAAVFHFLAFDESSYVTGANYLVDGGFRARSAIHSGSGLE